MAKILIVDDDPDILTSIRIVLESAGHEVLEAVNGKAGLKILREDEPDLIILDVMMDTATEGFQLALQLKNPDPKSDFAEFSHIPILMLTAIHSTTPLRFEPDIDYLPVELFVDKPIDPEELLGKVEWVLGEEVVD